MTRVVFVNPLDSSITTTGLGLKAPPLNLMYLAGAVEQAGFSPSIVDANLLNAPPEKITEIVARLHPDLVGLTATTATISKAFQYVRKIRDAVPECFIFIGGPHVTFLPSETLAECRELNAVVIGEGEETVVDLVTSFSMTDPHWPETVRGIAYRRNDGDRERIVVTPARELIQNLDALPFPARHLVPFNEYKLFDKDATIGYMITSRGCTFASNYCSSSHLMGGMFRARSPKNVVDEVEELVSTYHVDTIEFLDDNFMLNRSRAIDIAHEIRSRGLDISFVASSRVNAVNRDLLMELKKAGLSTIYYGVESGSLRTLKLMNKRITLSMAEDAVRIAKDCGISVLTSFIIGYPGETYEDMNATIRFAIRLDPDYAQFTILTPYPGTPIFQELKKNNLLATEDWDRYTVLEPIIRYEAYGLTSRKISRKLKEAYLRFYLRPGYLFRRSGLLKTVLYTLYHSYFRPAFLHSDPQGWYRNFPGNELSDCEKGT
ncbi:B12-binding domain-containing radical SAM protein [Methanosphaerula palustris]|uniref:Radical SAM domain protein n=1 Tax=Methanosphaerula palustris (strain ATCC BAA-1556 / DSM 19958 / E1-9c) TaxID=521011 RepID=B8GFG5_METPE|nr:radical SAM protein [Methanosphaerula palustris]ACL16013.1 Radical SAM domain protein [Methanosphaerula palustris E1-9c]